MPRPLPDVLLEEVLLRLPPHEPAWLFRAALVSRRWCRLVSDPGFRRRFHLFHRRPPLLGMLCNFYHDSRVATARFIPTTAFCTPRTDFRGMSVLDARHGRVLFQKGVRFLAVWDPITDRVQEIPFPQESNFWAAAVLCSAAAGACDHLDCHSGPFLVVCLCQQSYGEAFMYTYSSNTAAWSEPVGTQQGSLADRMGSVLVGNALYFGIDLMGSTTLKYNFELRQMSRIQLPSSLSVASLVSSLLTTTEDGGLGFITKDDSKLLVWSRKDTDHVDAKWERRVTIDLNTVFPVDVDVTELNVIGSGVDIIFMGTDNEVYTVDLKNCKVKRVYKGTAHSVFLYMSFYTPALEASACSGDEPSAGGSGA